MLGNEQAGRYMDGLETEGLLIPDVQLENNYTY
jgi:hypothetical protein